jgi:hypothetical protein
MTPVCIITTPTVPRTPLRVRANRNRHLRSHEPFWVSPGQSCFELRVLDSSRRVPASMESVDQRYRPARIPSLRITRSPLARVPRTPALVLSHRSVLVYTRLLSVPLKFPVSVCPWCSGSRARPWTLIPRVLIVTVPSIELAAGGSLISFPSGPALPLSSSPRIPCPPRVFHQLAVCAARSHAFQPSKLSRRSPFARFCPGRPGKWALSPLLHPTIRGYPIKGGWRLCPFRPTCRSPSP